VATGPLILCGCATRTVVFGDVYTAVLADSLLQAVADDPGR
jgi:hypothetical protein